ncbi:MAG TPA: hypothetical protein VFR71_02575 [Methyloceanibacter sp.]|nr:hypothetical protein [Methyloceanibacter sp.]
MTAGEARAAVPGGPRPQRRPRHVLVLFFAVLAFRVGQDTLDDVDDFSRVGAVLQQFSKRRGSNLGVFSR